MLVHSQRSAGLLLSPGSVLPHAVVNDRVVLRITASATTAFDAVEFVACSVTQPAASPHDVSEPADALQTAIVYARVLGHKLALASAISRTVPSIALPLRVTSLDYVRVVSDGLASMLAAPEPPRAASSWRGQLELPLSIASAPVRIVAVGRRSGRIVAMATAVVDQSERIARLSSIAPEPQLRWTRSGVEIVPPPGETALLWRRSVGSLELEAAGEYSSRTSVSFASAAEAAYVAATRSRDGASSTPGVRLWTPERRRSFASPKLSLVPADAAVELRVDSPSASGRVRIERRTGAAQPVEIAASNVSSAAPYVVRDQPPLGRSTYRAVVTSDGGISRSSGIVRLDVDSRHRESSVVVADPRVEALADGHRISIALRSSTQAGDASIVLRAAGAAGSGRFFESELASQREKYDPLLLAVVQRVDLDTGAVVELGVAGTGSFVDDVALGSGTRLRYAVRSAQRHPLSLVKGRVSFTGSAAVPYAAETSKFLHPLALDFGQLSPEQARQYLHPSSDAAIGCSAFASCVDVSLTSVSDGAISLRAAQLSSTLVELTLADSASASRDGYVVVAKFDDGGSELVSYVHPLLSPTKRFVHSVPSSARAVSYRAAAVDLDGAVRLGPTASVVLQ